MDQTSQRKERQEVQRVHQHHNENVHKQSRVLSRFQEVKELEVFSLTIAMHKILWQVPQQHDSMEMLHPVTLHAQVLYEPFCKKHPLEDVQIKAETNTEVPQQEKR